MSVVRFRSEWLALPLALAAALLAYLLINQQQHLERERQLTLHWRQLSSIASNINTEISHARDALLELQHKSEYFAQDNDLDLDQATLAWALNVLATVSPNYLQVRYLNIQGDEVIRYDRKGDKVVAAKPEQLQNKHSRDYFKYGLALDDGDVYVSDFDLNIEHGVIEQPWQPTLRLAVTIQAGQTINGVIVVNLNASSVVAAIQQAELPTYLIRHDGAWALGPDPQQHWSYVLDRPQYIFDHPDAPPSTSLLETEQASWRGAQGGYWLSLPLASNYWSMKGEHGSYLINYVPKQPQMAVLLWLTAFSVVIAVLCFVAIRRWRQHREQIQIRRIEDEKAKILREKLESSVVARTQHLNDSLALIRAITDNLPMVVALWDERLCCRFINNACLSWFGKPPDSFLQTQLSELLDHQHLPGNCRQQAMFTMPMQLHQLQQPRQIQVQYAACLYENGKQGWVTIFTDVTEAIEQREALEQQTAKAEAAARTKSEFLANMSHEIRTPMNAIIGMLTVLKKAQLDSVHAAYAEKAHSAAVTLLQILNDILDVSKLDSGKLEVEKHEFALDEIIDTAMDLFALPAENKGLQLALQIDANAPTRLIGDRLRISQILHNLLSNAIKFTAEGKVSLSIHIGLDKQHVPQLCFDVADTGIGFDKEFKDKLFGAFSQADASTTRRFGGSGLGLSISRQLAQLLGGDISAISKPGMGTCFTLTLPLAECAAGTTYKALAPNAVQLTVVTHQAEQYPLLQQLASAWDIALQFVPPASGLEAGQQLQQLAQQPEHRLWVDMRSLQACASLQALPVGELAQLCQLVLLTPQHLSGSDVAALNALDVGIISLPLTPAKIQRAFSLTSHSGPSDVDHDHQADWSHLKVLVVDDVAVNLEVASLLLGQLGIRRIVVVTSGNEALQEARQGHFDLVLMDVHMDGKDGITTTRELRAMFEPDKCPVVIGLSASAMEQDKRIGLEAGMTDYLTKPLGLVELEQALVQHLSLVDDHANIDNSASSLPPTQPEATDTSALPVFIDLAQVEQRFRGNSDVIVKCLSIFEHSLPRYLEELKQAYDQQDVTHLAGIAHSIKGAAGNICDQALFELASEVETQLKQQGSDAKVSALIQLIELHHQQLLEYQRPAESHGEQLGRAEFNQAMAAIADVIESHGIVDHEQLAGVCHYLHNHGRQDSAKALQSAVECFEYEQAKDVIDEVTQELNYG